MTIIQSLFGTPIPETCGNCLQHKGCKNPCIPYSGKGKEKILIIGEWPSSSEDAKGKFFSGSSGIVFRQQIKLMGYTLDEDFWYMKAVGCTSPKPPSKSIIKNCRKIIYDAIEKLQPKAIFVMGNVAIDSVIGEWVDRASANSLSGLQIPLHDQNCWVFPMLAPEYVAKNKRDENLEKYFLHNMITALKACEDLAPLKKLEYLDDIEILTDPDLIVLAMQEIILSGDVSAFDLETSGLNPYIKGHRIFSIAISTQERTIAFALDYPGAYKSKEDLEAVWNICYDYWENEKCPKIAHRTDFEYSWTKIAVGADTKNMHWCTKTTQHIVDNRTGITGLKHQCFTRWGVKDFGKAADPYIKSVPGTVFNRMHKMPLMEQLLYVGTDAWMTMELFLAQKEELKSLDTQRFFNDVTNMFSEMSINGICMDSRFYEQEKIKLEKIVDDIYQDLYVSQEIISYENKYGEINFGSNDDIRLLFYTHLGCTASKKTSGGQDSVDFASLEKTGHWIAKKLLKIRKLLKVKDTYIAQFQREVIDGKIHPSFNVYIARSLRSSSARPNFQNIPKRDELSKLITRSGLKPSPGNRLVELDFSGAEVITSSAYNEDPNLIAYLLDETTDMHRDGASDIWCTSPANISGKVRFYAKNCWTFPQFYGDYFGSCAKALWEHKDELLEDGKTCLAQLKNKNIGTLKKFTSHCKRAEEIMWGERFKVYAEWRKDLQKVYQDNDFVVSTFFGFEFIGYMDWKQVANYPIQGTSFHLLLIVLLKMFNWLKREGMKTKLCGQIHDSGFFDSPENEYQIVIKQFQKYTKKLKEEYKWLPVEMKADAEVSLLNGDFARMFEWKWDKDLEEMESKAKKKWAKIEYDLIHKED